MLNKTSFFSLITVALVSLAGIAGCGKSEAEGTKTLILAHAMHVTHPVTLGMDYMAERLEEISGGKMKMQVYPAGQLGDERSLLELVQLGAVAVTKVSGASLENIVPDIRVLSLPYLFEDDAHYRRVINGEVGKALLDSGIPYKLKGLAYYDAGFRSFYTAGKPLVTPEDMRGMKIRVQPSVMAIKLIRQLGGSPTPLSYGELYTAFQGGIVDGAENNPPSYYSSRHYEVTDYYIINEHTAVPDILIISTTVWDSLTSRQQQWLRQAVDESVAHQHELWTASELESMQVVTDAGVEVIYPDKEPFRQQVEPIYEMFRQQYPDLYNSWVNQIRNNRE